MDLAFSAYMRFSSVSSYGLSFIDEFKFKSIGPYP